ncbi:MAG: hypothetical protein IKA56_05860 [Clostridia bacterium]|nr:hypothetical protein [Clostridia bacterium]
MKEYKWAKPFIIATSVLTCLIVLLTFGLSYFKSASIVRPASLVTEELVKNATSISVEYKDESITFEKADEVRRICERFLEAELSNYSQEPELPGKITFHTTHPDSGEATILEIGFDEKLEAVQIEGKMYRGYDLLKLKNLLVTLTMGDLYPTTTAPSSTTTTAPGTTEPTTEKDTAYYSTESLKFDWAGSKAFLDVANHCENYDDILKDEKKNFPIIRITSATELEGFIDSVKEHFELSKGVYDESFFSEKELYIIYIEENAKKTDYSVSNVSIDGEKLSVKVERADKHGEDLASRFILLSIEKKAVEKCTQFRAYSEF